MAKRIKKPPVDPELSRKWLQRYEEGESPPQIARSDKFDVRTVRKHIELAKQEREVREARSIVLRSALESHYADLCKFAARLDAEITGEGTISASLREDRMWSALRQHLLRAPLWNYISKWDRLQGELAELRERIRALLTEEAESDPGLSPILTSGEGGNASGIVTAMEFEIETMVRGSAGLNVGEHFRLEPAGEGYVEVWYSSFHIGRVQEQQAIGIKRALADFQSRLAGMREGDDLRQLLQRLDQLKLNLRDELAVIVLRRVVPGRCRYCPI